MNARLLIALFVLMLAHFFALSPVTAATLTPANPGAVAAEQVAAERQACPADLSGLTLAQIAQMDCCKGHKGICGCRAGKLVCCDNTVSNDPNCACHGDSGMMN